MGPNAALMLMKKRARVLHGNLYNTDTQTHRHTHAHKHTHTRTHAYVCITRNGQDEQRGHVLHIFILFLMFFFYQNGPNEQRGHFCEESKRTHVEHQAAHLRAYVSIRQHTSARQSAYTCRAFRTPHAYVSIRQHSAYVSIRQRTHVEHQAAYLSVYCIYVYAYVSIRQHTSAYVSVHM